LPERERTAAGVGTRRWSLKRLQDRAASPRRDQRCEGEVELADGDGGQVRVDLGVIGQPGGDQLGADVPYRRDLQAVAHRPADRETARRGDVDQAPYRFKMPSPAAIWCFAVVLAPRG